MTFNAAVELLSVGRPDKIAAIDDDGAYTYAELADRAYRAATALAELGVREEQRVALCLLDSVTFPATFLGAILLGAVPVPLNTLLPASDYAYLLRDMRAAAAIVSPALAGKFEQPVTDFAERIARATRRVSAAVRCEDDVCFWLYSSGSTGKPKGATHLHGSLRQTAELYAKSILGITEHDVVYSAAKLFFAYGLGNALTFPLSVGATAVLCSERPTPATVARVMHAHQPTIFGGVPTLFAQLLADESFTAPTSLRISTSAGEALPRHVGERWKQRTGTDILDGIGSTEMLHIFLSNRPSEIAYGTTGKVVPGYELELRDDDDRTRSTTNEGVLWVRGPTACSGYWNDRARSLSTFHGPWTRTGDRYSYDPSTQTWTYGGRADDMLKVGGIWVSPFEVESALAAHPSVLEAAVVGCEDGEKLIKPKAFVVLRPGAAANPDELKAFVKDRLAPYKYPRWVELVTELPKTATGKIQRFKLR